MQQWPHARVLIADTLPIMRAGLRWLLTTRSSFTTVDEASSGVEAIRSISKRHPDLALVDNALPDLCGIDLVQTVASLANKTKVMLLCTAPSSSLVVSAIRQGAFGVLDKRWDTELLLRRIEAAGEGHQWIDASVIRQLSQISGNGYGHENRYGLTSRELDVVALIMSGAANKDIAERLQVSLQTVKHHLTNIFDKVGVYSRLELVVTASSKGLSELLRNREKPRSLAAKAA